MTTLADMTGINVEPWMARAACRRIVDPDVMFPDPSDRKGIEDAKYVCAECPIARTGECLTHALQWDERFGIWGGLTEKERRKLTRRPPTWSHLCGTKYGADRHYNRREQTCGDCRAAIAETRRIERLERRRERIGHRA